MSQLNIKPLAVILQAAIILFAMVWCDCALAGNPPILGTAETVIGGELILVEQQCIIPGLGVGYYLYLTNTRGSTIGRGCAMPNALPGLGIMPVHWGDSPVHGEESYPLVAFTWSDRGRVTLASVFAAMNKAKAKMQAKQAAAAKEKVTNESMVAELDNPTITHSYLGLISYDQTDVGIRNSDGTPFHQTITVIITPRDCRALVERRTPEQNVLSYMDGKGALEVYPNRKVTEKGCALPNEDGSITVYWDYHNDSPVSFSAAQIEWEPSGKDWINQEASGGARSIQ